PRIHSDVSGDVELPVAAAHAAPLGEEGARVRELLDAVVGEIGDEDIAVAIDVDATGAVELPVAAARDAPLGEEGSVIRELLDDSAGQGLKAATAVAPVGDVDVAAPIHGDDNGGGELPVPSPTAPPLEEEDPAHDGAGGWCRRILCLEEPRVV